MGGEPKYEYNDDDSWFLAAEKHPRILCYSLNRQPALAVKTYRSLDKLVEALRVCRRCSQMQFSPVTGGAVSSRVILVGQAPGFREPQVGRPFAWTAGKTLFKWFADVTGVEEDEVRTTVYMAAVCRCFPGKTATGDRVPSRGEIENCSSWLDAEIRLLSPGLIVPVGKLAIAQFIQPVPALSDIIGQLRKIRRAGKRFDLIPLPHPSGASPWHRIEPGKSLTRKALELIRDHPAWRYRATPRVTNDKTPE